ncbi:hypothetical protein [Nannocystis punicea]|uniref:Intracellular proteinase inhibitor BsuPI domain-containing protein n=1 Tax=Nannocystis punicea TaxID=2995304 RepID=A0ABY7GWJ8_9BACT|nr:hypothetical protein [Nannocystis poenicansa]WAS91323.1 hypothetical protein O0S08_34480 [Nannocystis poenicansa]
MAAETDRLSQQCVVADEETVASVKQRCSHGESSEQGTPTPSLRAELVPERVVVPSGALARFAVRLTNAGQRRVRLILNCSLRHHVRAADGTSTLPPEVEGESVCPAEGLAVDLEPGATLRFEEELEARRWVPMDPGPDANGFRWVTHTPWEPGPALPPGPYALEVDLPGIPTADGSSMTVRGVLQVE